MEISIRNAEKSDIPRLGELLLQVHRVHSEGRPDIFRRGSRKYTDGELLEILEDPSCPIYVALIENRVVGYLFAQVEDVKDDRSLEDRRSFYIDDLCVDECMRGCGIGEALYRYALVAAKELSAYHVTLNVWSLNPSAMRFYEKMGLVPMKVTMEQKL